MWISIISIIILLALSAFFSGSETALTAASPAIMHEKQRENDKKAGIVNRLIANYENLIGSILLGNNLVNILATSISTGLMIELFGNTGVVYATIIMTILVLVFSEIIPKTYAIRNPNKTALNVAPVMYVVVKLMSPVVMILQFIIHSIFKLFGVNNNKEKKSGLGLAEIRGVINMQKGKEIKQERAMLRSVLDLGDVHVYEIMTHRRNMFTIDISKPVKEIIDLVLEAPFSRIPVWRDKPDNIVGILRAKGLMRAVKDHKGDIETLNIAKLVAKPWFILETTNLKQQLQDFRAKREHFAIVVDEYGTILGIVTLEDVLEEIVGDITDETDESSIDITGIRPAGDGSFLVDGRVTIRDLNRRFDWNLPDEEAATIAGFLMHETERIPEQGQKYLFYGFEFIIEQRNRNQIATVRITPKLNAI